MVATSQQTGSYKGINWIASYPKAGNTYVRILLDAYLYGRVDINNIRTSGDSMPGLVQPAIPYAWTDLNEPALIQLRFIACLWQMYNGKMNHHPFVKSHWMAKTLGEVFPYPTSLTYKTLYLVRDPRDVAASLSRHLGVTPARAIAVMATDGFTTQVEREKKILPQVWGSWVENVVSHWSNRNSTTLIVRYEDLVDDTVNVFASILDHFEIGGGDVKQAIELANIDRIKEQEKQNGFTESGKAGQFFTDSRKSKWKTVLSDSEERAVMKLYRDLPGYVRKELRYA